MPYCQKCGASVDDEAKFCPECATPTSGELPRPPVNAGSPPAPQPAEPQAQVTPTKAPAKPERKKVLGGCLVLLVLLVAIIAIVAALTSGHGKSKSTASSASQQANAYIQAHGSDAYLVQSNVQFVKADIRAVAKSATPARINHLAQDAQDAHNNIDNLRDNFASSIAQSGTVSDAEYRVVDAVDKLKNAMGALVAYTGNPNPATLASFTSQYQPTVAEWNEAVTTIWQAAGKPKAPIL